MRTGPAVPPASPGRSDDGRGVTSPPFRRPPRIENRFDPLWQCWKCSVFVSRMDDATRTHRDPEIAALLDFQPVPRKCPRRHGWSPENQRAYIARLAETGDVELAADAVGLSGNGARQLRKCVGAGEFKAAWDAALDLRRARNRRRPASAPAAPAPEPSEAEKAKDEEEWLDGILQRYWLKLKGERRARLAGRIAEADYYVRQLTWIELCLDLGGRSLELLQALKRGGHDLLRITATPMSVLLDQVRRTLWREGGEPERPPLGPLGEHDGEVALGEPTYFQSSRDGDFQAWEQRRRERAALAAEAQAAWEEKARADAEEWARREGVNSSPAFAGEGDHPQDGGGASKGAADGSGPDETEAQR
jgi:hypothetical protein